MLVGREEETLSLLIFPFHLFLFLHFYDAEKISQFINHSLIFLCQWATAKTVSLSLLSIHFMKTI